MGTSRGEEPLKLTLPSYCLLQLTAHQLELCDSHPIVFKKSQDAKPCAKEAVQVLRLRRMLNSNVGRTYP